MNQTTKPATSSAGGENLKRYRRLSDRSEDLSMVSPLRLQDCCQRCEAPLDDCRCD